ncbi:MAG: 4-hydroxythreonine-4-phosphate dehydrogenase PdxA [Fibrobacteres bacterium]|nr:4-hydroxythreonine-4-phosphate dehydrogenase PdxA [Fibrobacterota bacterium]
MKTKLPVLALTVGDPFGIGPEIAIKTAARKDICKICEPVLYGSEETISDTASMLGLSLKGVKIRDTGRAIKKIIFGKTAAEAGEESMLALDAAIHDVKKGIAKAIVTAPLSKEAVVLSGRKNFCGHTGYIAAAAGNPFHCLALYADNKCIAFVTLHESIKSSLGKIRKERIVKISLLLDSFLKKLLKRSPKIAVSGLNPHAGEAELFGSEERNEIEPATRALLKKRVKAYGPVPPDVVYPALFAGRCDGVVSMLHDHGHVAFKTALFEMEECSGKTSGVNVTLGLPFVRTSADHGTAFDIAGKGVADEGSLCDAVRLAANLVK